ncbi:fasciclin domain-containing protein [Nocardioides insulae]|uniref:fasciclin domain-containing protein n=1 Tax=Nocardioides insulae TaxID=394734 RepID=UPI000423BA68|nr:fasciclin domain-containing protein [Nocardioides insulae]
MLLHQVRRTSGIVALAAVLALPLAACGGEDDTSDAAGSDETSAATDESSMSEDAMATEVFGDGCSQVPTAGEGSVGGMVDDPVATAAANNPLLTTLTTAIGSIDGLSDTLNSAEALTVFAPVNSAFEEIPPKDLQAMVEDGQKNGEDSDLYGVLAHHVVGENADATAVVGEHETLAGDTLTVEGDPETGMTVSDGTVTAKVLCGNVPTANATVYVIDSVLTGTG